MEPRQELSLIIDGREVTALEGTSILDAARAAGRDIPTLCHHPALTPFGGCRLCVVEVDGSPKLVASCVTPVRKGMQVVTSNERILEARRTILEFLFSERGHYCMFCAQSGDCELQSLAYEHGLDHFEAPSLEQDFPTDASHPDLVIDHNRCVLCGRCVRACREIVGSAVLDFHERGGRTMVGADLAGPLGTSSCVSCGVCMQVCPTGAIFNRHRTHYAVKGKLRTWYKVDSACALCEELCSAQYLVRDNVLLKVEGSLNKDGEDRGQLCRRGRFEPFMAPGPRLIRPLARENGEGWRELDSSHALKRLALELAKARDAGNGGTVLGLASGSLSNSALSAMKTFFKAQLPDGILDGLEGDYLRSLKREECLDDLLDQDQWGDILSADLILEIGGDAGRSHPLVRSICRRAVIERHSKLVMMGPQVGAGAEWSLRLPVGPRKMSALLRALANSLTEQSEPPSAEFTSEQGFAELLDDLRAADRPLLIICPEAAKAPGLLRSARRLAQTLDDQGRQGRRVLLLRPFANLALTQEEGLLAASSAGFRDFQAALLLPGAADQLDNGLKGRLQKASFVAAITPYFCDDIAEVAHLLIPCPTWLESGGNYSLGNGEKRTLKEVLKPPTGVYPLAATMAALAEKMAELD